MGIGGSGVPTNVIVAVGPATADPADTTSNASTATVAAMILRIFVLLPPPLCPPRERDSRNGFRAMLHDL